MEEFMYGTPHLHDKRALFLKPTLDMLMSSLCSIERWLIKDPTNAQILEAEIQKLIGSGYVIYDKSSSFGLYPHHLVQHHLLGSSYSFHRIP